MYVILQAVITQNPEPPFVCKELVQARVLTTQYMYSPSEEIGEENLDFLPPHVSRWAEW